MLLENAPSPREILQNVLNDIEKGNLIKESLGTCGSPKGCLLGLLYKHGCLDTTHDKLSFGDSYDRPYPAPLTHPDHSDIWWTPEAREAARQLVKHIDPGLFFDTPYDYSYIYMRNDQLVRGEDIDSLKAWVEKTLHDLDN